MPAFGRFDGRNASQRMNTLTGIEVEELDQAEVPRADRLDR